MCEAADIGDDAPLASVASPLPGRSLEILNLRLGMPAPRLGVGSATIFHCFDFVPVFFASTATIATIHDVAYLKMPDAVRDRAFSSALHDAVRRALPRCDALVAVSQRSKVDIIDVYGCQPDRIHVVYNWVSDEIIDAGAIADDCPARPGPYILSVGTVQPHKNYHTALDAIARIADRLPHSYVVAGPHVVNPAYVASLRQRACDLGIAERVHFLGQVGDGTLARLYRDADLVLFPSFYEGFGYPLVEAMHFGKPIVSSNGGSLGEVAGEAAIIVAPDDVSSMAEAIEAAVLDSAVRSRLIEAGRDRLPVFSKERAIGQILEIYRSLE